MNATMTSPLEFLERLESETTDKQTAEKIRDYMIQIGTWEKVSEPVHVPKNPEVSEQIVYNAVKCEECKEIIQSYHGHDYKTCSCDNQAMVDGGLNYARYGAVDMGKITKITYTTGDPFDLIRAFFCWGTYGKYADQPLKYIKLKDMSDEHVRAVIVWKGVQPWIIDLMKQEIDYRAEFNISITE